MAAESKAQLTGNFIRISGLVVDVGTEALRDVLYSEIPPDQLSTELIRNKGIIENLLNGRPKVIDDTQYQLLTKTNPDAKEFDITLLVVVIRNICKNIEAPSGSDGWRVKPDRINETHHSLGDEILRLKNIRNSAVAHTPSTHMPTEKFEELWVKISDIIRQIVKKTPNQTDAQTDAKLESIHKQIAELREMKVDFAGDRETRWREEFRKGLLQELEAFERYIDEILLSLDITKPTDVMSFIEMMKAGFKRILQVDEDSEAWKAVAKDFLDSLSMRKASSQWRKSLDQRKRQIQHFAYDAYIFYAEEDTEACQESARRLKELSQVPGLNIALYQDLKLEDFTLEERMEYILGNCRLSLFYVTSSLKSDTMKKFETDMCLTAVIKEQSNRAIPLWTKRKNDIPDIPKALDALSGLQLWMLDGNEDEQKRVITRFDDTIKSGRQEVV